MLLGRQALHGLGIELQLNKHRESKTSRESNICPLNVSTKGGSLSDMNSFLHVPSEVNAINNLIESKTTITDSFGEVEAVSDLLNINYDQGESELDINLQVDRRYSDKIRRIIETEYLSPKEKPAPRDYEMIIRLNSDVPFHHRPRRLSFEERDALKKITDDLLARNIIRPSDSPYASAIVLVHKKTGEYRKCVD